MGFSDGISFPGAESFVRRHVTCESYYLYITYDRSVIGSVITQLRTRYR